MGKGRSRRRKERKRRSKQEVLSLPPEQQLPVRETLAQPLTMSRAISALPLGSGDEYLVEAGEPAPVEEAAPLSRQARRRAAREEARAAKRRGALVADAPVLAEAAVIEAAMADTAPFEAPSIEASVSAPVVAEEPACPQDVSPVELAVPALAHPPKPAAIDVEPAPAAIAPPGDSYLILAAQPASPFLPPEDEAMPVLAESSEMPGAEMFETNRAEEFVPPAPPPSPPSPARPRAPEPPALPGSSVPIPRSRALAYSNATMAERLRRWLMARFARKHSRALTNPGGGIEELVTIRSELALVQQRIERLIGPAQN